MKNKFISFPSAILLTLIFAANIFSQTQLNIFDETRQRITDNSISKVSESNFELEKRVFLLINNLRVKNGLKELIWSDEIANIARQHSQSMADNNFFSHRGLDGLMINQRADAAGLKKWRLIGENIAYNRGYAKPVEFAVECWMKSQGHRENLLDPRWKETGIGIAIAKDGSYYFTQDFLVRK